MQEGRAREILIEEQVFPEEPLISEESWSRLKEYYINQAPSKLILNDRYRKRYAVSRVFKPLKSDLEVEIAGTTMVNFEENGGVVIGDSFDKKIHFFDSKLKHQKAFELGEGIVDYAEDESGYYVLVMGEFAATDEPKGAVWKISKEDESASPIKILGDLKRPPSFERLDIDGDGMQDFLICEFGKWVGYLAWWKNLGNEQYEKKVIRSVPGAIKSIVRDFNEDGLPDFITLFAQGDEALIIHINEGDGIFKESKVLQFSPSNGSSFFDLVDFNGDGLEDIIYTAGDNADYAPILKNYHGLYLFENKGDFQFEQTHFEQLNGAFNARIADFDLDGDLDIAVISFFPDFDRNIQEGFVLLMNDGQGNYLRETIQEVVDGRWLVMNASDYDSDGDVDLILGSLPMQISNTRLMQNWMTKKVNFLVLQNQSL